MPHIPSSSANPVKRKGKPNRAASVVDARSEKAWRAVRQVTGLLPTFTSFARAITGNPKVRVQLGVHGAETDGETIWIFPQIAFGEDRTHDRSLCDRRGPDKNQLCKACAAREDLMCDLFHETAHIAADSHVQPDNGAREAISELIDEWHPSAACLHAGPLHSAARRAKTHMELLGAHNGFLLMLFKVLEDARVDARMFKARPGLKVMFEANTKKIFESGVEHSDGTRTFWKDAQLNLQVLTGLLLIGSGYGLPDGYLSQEAVDALQDESLQRLAHRAALAPTAHQISEISIETFRRLNEMGFCRVQKCEVPTPPPPSPPSETDDEESNAEQQQDDSDSEADDDSRTPQIGDDPGPDPGDGDGEPDDSSSEGSTAKSDSTNDSTEPDDSDQSDSESDGGGAGDAEDQQDAGDPEDTGSPGSAAEDSSGDGEGDAGEGSGADHDEDTTSSDDGNRGQDDDHDSPEGEERSGGHQPASGAGGGDDGRSSDRTDMEPSSDTKTEGDEGDGSEDGDDSSAGESSSGESAVDSADEEPAEQAEDVSESVWDDPANAEAAASQYDRTSFGEGFPDDSGDEAEGSSTSTNLDYGDPSEVEEGLRSIISSCEKHDKDGVHDREAVNLAVVQGRHFDTSRVGVGELLEFTYPHIGLRWTDTFRMPSAFAPSETLMGRATMEARLALEDNQRAEEARNLKTGRIDRRAIGKRAPVGDPRMFYKRSRPGKKDYFFAIGLDISGSTNMNDRNPRILRAAFAQAELLSRLGHKFAIYGMTGGRNPMDLRDPNYYLTNDVWVLKVKDPNEPWSPAVRQRLADLRPCSENFDGHNLEYLRKVLDTRTETSRAIIYYTDGDMPARNRNEELAVMANELATCKRRGYTLLAVGINTDSPRQYGLNTVQVDSDEDLIYVIRQLGEHLTSR